MSSAVRNLTTPAEIVIRRRDPGALSFEGVRIGVVRSPEGVTLLDEWDVTEALGLSTAAELTKVFVAVRDQDFRAVVLNDREMPAHVTPHGAIRMAASARTARAQRFAQWIGKEILRPRAPPRSGRGALKLQMIEGGRL